MLASIAMPPTFTESPPSATGAPFDVLLGLFVLFVAAKVGEEVARRLGQPAVIGELLGGFLVGPGALALVVPGEAAFVLAELGVVILLFSVGLEVRLDDLLAVGRPAVLTAVIASLLPIIAGIGVVLATGSPPARRPSSASPWPRPASASRAASCRTSACSIAPSPVWSSVRRSSTTSSH